MLEELTWPVIAREIGNGALQGLGGQAYDALFGNSIEAQFRKFLEEMSKIVRQLIKEDRIREYENDLKTLATLLNYYRKDGSYAEFKRLVEYSVRTTNQLYSMGLAACGAMCVSASIQITLVCEPRRLAKPDEDNTGKNEVIILCYKDLYEKCDKMKSLGREEAISRFGPLYLVNDYYGSHDVNLYDYLGKVKGGSENLNLAESMREQDINEEIEKMRELVDYPINELNDQWLELVNNYTGWQP